MCARAEARDCAYDVSGSVPRRKCNMLDEVIMACLYTCIRT